MGGGGVVPIWPSLHTGYSFNSEKKDWPEASLICSLGFYHFCVQYASSCKVILSFLVSFLLLFFLYQFYHALGMLLNKKRMQRSKNKAIQMDNYSVHELPYTEIENLGLLDSG